MSENAATQQGADTPRTRAVLNSPIDRQDRRDLVELAKQLERETRLWRKRVFFFINWGGEINSGGSFRYWASYWDADALEKKGHSDFCKTPLEAIDNAIHKIETANLDREF